MRVALRLTEQQWFRVFDYMFGLLCIVVPQVMVEAVFWLMPGGTIWWARIGGLIVGYTSAFRFLRDKR